MLQNLYVFVNVFIKRIVKAVNHFIYNYHIKLMYDI